MLQCGRNDSEMNCAGRTFAADMTRDFPVRSCLFDAAISISVIQWLCVDSNPQTAAERFFRNLFLCLRPGGRAVLQMYTESDAQIGVLLESSLTSGFITGCFVDFPHSTPAKKLFLCLAKPEENTVQSRHSTDHEGPAGATTLDRITPSATDSSFAMEPVSMSNTREQRTQQLHRITRSLCHGKHCPLAWPSTRGSCPLPWILYHMKQQPISVHEATHSGRIHSFNAIDDAYIASGSCSEHFVLVAMRIRKEHRALATRALRLLRHAGRRKCQTRGDRLPGDAHLISEKHETWIGLLEMTATNPSLMPCGGSIVVHIRSLWRGEGRQQEDVPIWMCGEGGILPACAEWQVEEWTFSELKNNPSYARPSRIDVVGDSSQQRIRATADGSGTSSFWSWTSVLSSDAAISSRNGDARQEKKYFWLETLPSCRNGALLHADRMPVLMVITTESSTMTSSPQNAPWTMPSQTTKIGDVDALMQHEVHQWMQRWTLRMHAFSASYKACCLGVDVVIDSTGGLTCAWLLYIPKIETFGREKLAGWMKDIDNVDALDSGQDR